MKEAKGQLGTMHHYVPQSYLRLFSVPSNRDQVWAYEVRKEPYLTNVKNVASERDFYTYVDPDSKEKTAEFEEVLAKIDAQGIEVINKVAAMQLGSIELNEEDKAALLNYIALLHTRNTRSRRQFAEYYGQATLTYMQIIASNKRLFHKSAREAAGDKYTFDVAEESRMDMLDGKLEVNYDKKHQYFMGAALGNSEQLYRVLASMKNIALVGNDGSSRDFVTSDNPVSKYAPENFSSRLGLGYVHAIFQLPISPKRCILLINKDMQISDYTCSRKNVDHMNWYTYRGAEKWVFGHIKSKTIQEMMDTHNSLDPGIVISSPFTRERARKTE